MATSPAEVMVGPLVMSNGDSDKQACVLSILKEIKSYESGGVGDEEAVESLLLLGSQPSDALDAVDGLLHLNAFDCATNGFGGKRHCNNGAILPEVSVSDLGALLGDVVLPVTSNGSTNSTGILDRASLGSLPEDLLLGPDMSLSSPTKARQLLRSIEDDACGSLLSSSNLLSNAAFLLDSAGDYHRPDRPSTAPSTSSSTHSSPSSRLTRSLDDLHKVSTSSDLFSSFFVKRREESQSGPRANEHTTDVFGTRLPVVDSPDVPEDGPTRIFVSDVFQSFFSRRHFDAFRSILEENAVRPVPIRPRGVGEALETITVDELHRLLAMNKARKDGFVKCITLNSYAADAAPRTETKIINRDERSSGELTSGIRTRRAENQDIGYVEIDGMSLPSLMIDEVHYVRLVDVIRLLSGTQNDTPLSGPFISSKMARLKQVCRRLSLSLHHCSANDKARLVVVAQSMHHSSCVIMSAFDAPKLIAYERAKQQRRNAGGKRLSAYDVDAAQNGKRHKRDRGSPVDSNPADELVLDLDDLDDASTSSALTSPLGISRPPSASLRMDYPSATLTPDNCSRTLPLPGREGFDRRIFGPLLAQLTPCTVSLERSEPLLLVVCTVAASAAIDKRGPTGYYLDHLFVGPWAQCIRCQICSRFLTVSEFAAHFHGSPIANGRLMMLATKKKENPFDLWRSFNAKLQLFRLTELSRFVSPMLCRDRKTAQQRKSQWKAQLAVPAPPRLEDTLQRYEPLYRLAITAAPPTDPAKNDVERRAFFAKYDISEWIVGSRDPLKERALAELYGKAMK